ncbi:MAG: hypothetical protein K2K92_09270, partial [Duncaniella sp.]|nr:hypothetical protein [Duncaniella sp.]
MNKVILILVILFSPVFSKAWSQGMYEDINTDESGKVYICTNSGKEISAEQFRSINRYFIKKIFESDDTVRITLKGPGETRASYRELVNSYAADLKINGARCKYLKQELRESTPKTSQYNYTDSCFYLTFLLGHEFQTKGDMAEISAFLVPDSLPV